MSVAVYLLQPRVEVVLEDAVPSVAALVDADTVNGTTPGTVGLDVLAASTQAEAQAAIGVTGAAGTAAQINGRIGAHETALNPHRQYIGQAQAVLNAQFFGA